MKNKGKREILAFHAVIDALCNFGHFGLGLNVAQSRHQWNDRVREGRSEIYKHYYTLLWYYKI